MSARDQIFDLKQRIGAAVIGQEAVVDQLLIALLANGHLLMEGLPGLARRGPSKLSLVTWKANSGEFSSRRTCCPAISPVRRFTLAKAPGELFSSNPDRSSEISF
jgi:MoxR-like ATPase